MNPAPLLRFMAWPAPSLRARMARTLADARLDRALGTGLFAPVWWHQSLSLGYPDVKPLRTRLLHAGDALSARGLTLTFDRLSGSGGSEGPIHWAFRAPRDAAALAVLTHALSDSLESVDLPQHVHATPHITFCYRAPGRLRSMRIEPADWTIDTVHLVARHARPFRYEIIASWPLSAAARVPSQPSLPF